MRARVRKGEEFYWSVYAITKEFYWRTIRNNAHRTQTQDKTAIQNGNTKRKTKLYVYERAKENSQRQDKSERKQRDKGSDRDKNKKTEETEAKTRAETGTKSETKTTT